MRHVGWRRNGFLRRICEQCPEFGDVLTWNEKIAFAQDCRGFTAEGGRSVNAEDRCQPLHRPVDREQVFDACDDRGIVLAVVG